MGFWGFGEPMATAKSSPTTAKPTEYMTASANMTNI
jgi:hypothetical protein